MNKNILSTQNEIRRANKSQTQLRESEYSRYIANRLIAARKMADLTQEALAFELGLSFQQIQKYESATNRISVPRLISLANACGVGLEFFLDGLCDEDNTPRKSLPVLSAEAVAHAIALQNIEPRFVRATIMNLIQAIHQHGTGSACNDKGTG